MIFTAKQQIGNCCFHLFYIFRNAQKRDIIKAYRKLAREWHPDNFQDEKDKKNAEKKFIEIAAAKEVLSDPGMGATLIISCNWLLKCCS